MTDNAPPGEPGNPPAGATPGNDGVTIPKPRFDQLNERMKAAEKRLAEYDAAEVKRKDEEAAKRGEYEKITQRLEAEKAALAVKATEWDSYQTSRREALLAQLPPEHRAIAGSLALAQLESYVQLNTGKPPVVAGAPPGVKSPQALATAEEIRENQGKPGWLKANWNRIGLQGSPGG